MSPGEVIGLILILAMFIGLGWYNITHPDPRRRAQLDYLFAEAKLAKEREDMGYRRWCDIATGEEMCYPEWKIEENKRNR
jgi:hypothetical protein